MKKISETIVFFGNERIATGVATDAPTLRALIRAGYHVAAVVSHHDDQGPSRNARELEIESVAKAHNIPILLPSRLSEIQDQLMDLRASIGILVAYGKIVPQTIIDTFPRGIVNIHPSLLPLHRGPTPIESAILAGARETGVSIMQLSNTMDAGPLFGQRKTSLSGNESKQELADLLLSEGGDLLLELLPDILNGSMQPTPQNDRKASYDKLLSKQEGILDWQKAAEELEREVRAFAGWPKSHTELAGKAIVIKRAHVVEMPCKPGELIVRGQSLSIGTKHNALGVDSLTPAGKKEMAISAFLVGYGGKLQQD